MKKFFLRKTSLIVILVLLVFTSPYAYATEYWGSSTSYTAGSYSVRHASYMDVTSTWMAARTIINSASGAALPPGTIGVYPRGYHSNGALAEAGEWSYTDIRATGFDCPIYLYDIPGYLYSKGMTALWNGDSYTTKSTTASPNAEAQSSVSIMKVQVNSSGQTFGTTINATSIEDEPDLILAEGVDGNQGYVKSSDLNADMPKSPEEAVKMMKSKSLNEARFIPLYDSEGKTVIGKFKITSSDKKDIKTIIK